MGGSGKPCRWPTPPNGCPESAGTLHESNAFPLATFHGAHSWVGKYDMSTLLRLSWPAGQVCEDGVCKVDGNRVAKVI